MAEKDIAADVNWFPSSVPYGSASDVMGEEDRTAPVSFRVQKRLLRLMQELTNDPESPYYGMFKGQGDLPRHLFKVGILALAKNYKKTKGVAVSIIAREEATARAAFRSSRRKTMNDTTEALITHMSEAIQAGDVIDAVDILDGFLESLMDMDAEMRGDYAKALLNHANFQLMKNNPEVRKESKMLVQFESAYP